MEIVPVAMPIPCLCKGDVNGRIVEAASFGRDGDTIPRAVGCIAGAMQGAATVGQRWIETVEKANEEVSEEVKGDPPANFFSVAQHLVQALEADRRAAQIRVQMLEEILG